MSDPDQPAGRKTRKPPPRWRRYLIQAELELPPPVTGPHGPDMRGDRTTDDADETPRPWWQSRAAVYGLAVLCVALLVFAAVAIRETAQARAAAHIANERARILTLRAVNNVRVLRIAANPRSWSAGPDASIAWPDPPQLLEIHVPVGYAGPFRTFALVVDKVDHGRVMIVERMAPDSNRDLRLALNSSAFGPGEYRIRVQGYTWRGQRVDVGWIRWLVREPD